MQSIIVIAHNIRSTHNIGAIFRTCEGFGVDEIILSGYSPYPLLSADSRLPHISKKITEQIHKTALGAEALVSFNYEEVPPLGRLKADGYELTGLEQDPRAIMLNRYVTPDKVVLLLGEEVEGIDDALRSQCDVLLEIPMNGKKESFNVSVATGIALYGLTVNS
jgi:23S rRNA (guanosine2251-2'-O)-methyltransferase